jgi:putative restriction endonuclease
MGVRLYWWVNLSQARRHELDAGYLWSAQPAMRRARPGDVVFVHAGGQVAQLGLVTGAPFAARRSATAGRRGVRRSSEGLRLPVHFEELLQPLQPVKHLAALKKVLPARLAPLRAAGAANPAVYFAAVNEALAAVLCELLGGQVEELQRAAPALESSERADDVAEQALLARPDLDAGSRKRLLRARRGLGVYREHVERYEQSCRVTGLLDRRHLRARHIKPWRNCNDREKLDGCNGLLLSPHIDQLFERGLISFTDSGDLLVARQLNPAVLQAWGIALARNVGAFQPGQCSYLEWHRLQVFEHGEGGRRIA